MANLSSIQLLYRSDLDLLTVRWLADSPLSELQAEYDAVLATDQARHTGRWLLDVRRRPIPTAEATQWVTYDWLPRAAAALAPAQLRLAYLISPSRKEVPRTDTTLRPTVQDTLAPKRLYTLSLFADEGEAVRWLTA